MKPLLLLLISVIACLPAGAVDKLQGYCELGGQVVTVFGISSSTKWLQSYPSCTVTVYNQGTTTAATIYSDDASTPKANPFTADVYGFWFFYAAAGRYDVRFSAGGIATPFTRSDLKIYSSATGITSLGGLTGATQTFVNDTNVTMTSSSTTHTLGWTGSLSAARGGTGRTTLTANGVLLGNGTSAIGMTAAGLAYQVFRVPSAGGAPAFGQISLDQSTAVTGTLGIANGGTGQTTANTAFNALSPATTKGDLIVRSTVAARFPVGTDGYTIIADSAQTLGMKWGLLPLTSGVTGALPVANGGTGQTAAVAGFDALAPTTTKGDLIVHNGTDNIRLAVGANDQIPKADSTQASGLKWAAENSGCRKDTVAYSNAAFIAASATADVTLFTLTQYQKITGITIKHSAQYSDGAGAMTDVSVSIGKASFPIYYTNAWSIGEVTAAADTTFLDTEGFTSGTMAAAGQAVLARFTSTARDFGDGAATFLTGGSVDIWTCYQNLQ